jgi:hypothetical protein
VGDAWQTLRITEATAAQFFNGKDQNISVLLGEASGGLTDVDLDTIEAVRAAPYFLPPTLCFGRASKPSSHWLYQSRVWQTEDAAASQFKFATGTGKGRKEQMILELRIGGGGKGGQTVFPGSVHETGEAITWGEPAPVTRAEGAHLKRCWARAASAALLAAHFPSKGARHDAGLTLGGFLFRCGLNRPDTELFAEAVTIASGQGREKVRDVKKAAAEAWDEAKRPGGNARGFPALAETFGDDVAKCVAKWLGYRAQPDVYSDSTAPGPTNPIPVPTWEAALAREFIDRHGDEFRYVDQWGRWLRWEGARWANEATRLALDLAARICRESAQWFKDKGEPTPKDLGKFRTASSVEMYARHERCVAATVEQWDADQELFNMPEGKETTP